MTGNFVSLKIEHVESILKAASVVNARVTLTVTMANANALATETNVVPILVGILMVVANADRAKCASTASVFVIKNCQRELNAVEILAVLL